MMDAAERAAVHGVVAAVGSGARFFGGVTGHGRLQKEMGNGKWEMGNGKWEMGNSKREMGNGKWEMGNSKLEMRNERSHMGNYSTYVLIWRG